MKTMNALRFKKYGPPSVLAIEALPIPEPKPGEVLVKVHAAAINPSDVKNVNGQFGVPPPRVPGRDFSGTVVTEGLWKGKEVWGSGAGFGVARDGAHAEYVAVATDWLSEKPSTLSMAEAATVGVPYLAAWAALISAGKIQAGETILIVGSSGAVGRAATQIAHWRGATVIGAGIADRPSEADLYINTRTQDLLAEISKRTAGKGVDMVLDAVGGAMFETALKSLRLGGRQIAITSTAKRRVEFDLVDFYHQQQHLIGVDTMKLSGPEIANIMDNLRAGFAGGYLKPSAVMSWSLDHAVDAYEAVGAGDATRKHVLLLG